MWYGDIFPFVYCYVPPKDFEKVVDAVCSFEIDGRAGLFVAAEATAAPDKEDEQKEIVLECADESWENFEESLQELVDYVHEKTGYWLEGYVIEDCCTGAYRHDITEGHKVVTADVQWIRYCSAEVNEKLKKIAIEEFHQKLL